MVFELDDYPQNFDEPLLRKIADKCLEFIKSSLNKKLEEIARDIDTTPAVISHIRGLRYLNRKTFKVKGQALTRREVIDVLIETYSLKVHIEDIPESDGLPSVIITGPKAKIISIKHHFIYYHFEFDQQHQPIIVKSLMIITQNNQETIAELTLLKGDRDHIYEGKARRVASVNGEYEYTIQFFKKGKSHDYPHSTVIINVDHDGFQKKYLYATYNAAGPACGMAVLEKLDKEPDLAEIPNKEIPQEVLLDLMHQRIEVGAMPPLSDIRSHPEHNCVVNLQSYIGVYEGVTFSGDLKEYNRFVLEITPDFKVHYSSLITPIIIGVARPYDTSLIFIRLDYRANLRFYTKQMVIKCRPFTDGHYACILSGVDKDNLPISGKAILKKVKKSFEQACKNIQDNQLQNLKTDFPSLLDFFLGSAKFTNYVSAESTKILLRYLKNNGEDLPDILGDDIISQKSAKDSTFLNEHENHDTQRFAGVYRLYRLSTNGEFIIANVARLNEDGTAEIKGHIEGNYFTGRWFIVGDFLLIWIDRKNKNIPFLFTLAYFVGATAKGEFSWVHGVSLSMTSGARLRSGVEVLTPSEEKFDFAMGEEIDIPLPEKQSSSYHNLDLAKARLATFLTGKTNNLIHQYRSPNDKFIHDEAAKYLYFQSACYHAAKTSTNDPRKQDHHLAEFDRYMQLAIEHGFLLESEDQTLLQDERKNGLMASIPGDRWKW